VALPLAQDGERSLVQGSPVQDRERTVVATHLRRGCGCDVCPVGVCRTREPQRGTQDQDRNGESVPDGERECVHGFPLNADIGPRPGETGTARSTISTWTSSIRFPAALCSRARRRLC